MDQDGCVGPEEFVMKMSVFLRGTLPELVDCEWGVEEGWWGCWGCS